LKWFLCKTAHSSKYDQLLHAPSVFPELQPQVSYIVYACIWLCLCDGMVLLV